MFEHQVFCSHNTPLPSTFFGGMLKVALVFCFCGYGAAFQSTIKIGQQIFGKKAGGGGGDGGCADRYIECINFAKEMLELDDPMTFCKPGTTVAEKEQIIRDLTKKPKVAAKSPPQIANADREARRMQGELCCYHVT
eukprot:GHVN01092285.1.p1 GENE.GHVN01092285.1~~GHVN01092285.1.p1  ORF type:complete len:137 (+),score=17.66 GHVN01092285.1:349-759(+)